MYLRCLIFWVGVWHGHEVVLRATKTMVQNATFISISFDEVTTINNQSWTLFMFM
jgi:hypothetical protein